VDNGSTSLDHHHHHHHHLPDDESSPPYRSPSSLLSSSDSDRRSPPTWHTPRGSPWPAAGHDTPANRCEVDHPADDDSPDPAAAVSVNGDVVDEHSSPVWIPCELTSSDITVAAAEPRPADAFSQSDVEHG